MSMNSKLRNSLNPTQIERLENVGRLYAMYPIEKVRKYLWNLTFNKDYALMQMGLTDPEFADYYKKVRAYLLEQSECSEEIIPADIPNEQQINLFKALCQDKFALAKIVASIETNLFSDNAVASCKRTLQLLQDTREEMQFGGLRQLGLSYNEAVFFKPAVKEIAEYYAIRFDEMLKSIETQENTEMTREYGKFDLTPTISDSVEEVITEVEILVEGNPEEATSYDGEEKLELIRKLIENKDTILSLYEDAAEFSSVMSNTAYRIMGWKFPLERSKEFEKLCKNVLSIQEKLKILEVDGIFPEFLSAKYDFVKSLLSL